MSKKKRNSSTAFDRKKQFVAIQEILASNSDGVRSRELRELLSSDYGIDLDAARLRARLESLDSDGVIRFQGERSARTYWLVEDAHQTATPVIESSGIRSSDQGELDVAEPTPEIPRRQRKSRRRGRVDRSASITTNSTTRSSKPEQAVPPLEEPAQDPFKESAIETPAPATAPPKSTHISEPVLALVEDEAMVSTLDPTTQPTVDQPAAFRSKRYAELDTLLQELVGLALAEKDFEASRILFEAAQSWGELLTKRAGE